MTAASSTSTASPLIDMLNGWFAYLLTTFPTGAVITVLLMLVLLVGMYRVVNKENNTLQWEDLVATIGSDSKMHTDWDKIGKGAGVFLCVTLPFTYAHRDGTTPEGLALLLAACLLYLGGVSAYAAALRSKRDSKPQDGGAG